jgi:5-formyltetrahydrofolate cyclo-ligase
MSHMSDKARVRAAVLAARRALPAADRAGADRALVATAVELARGADRVAAYAPMPGEPGGPDLVDALAAVVGDLLLPVLEPDLDLDWARYDGPLVDRAGSRLREPVGPVWGPEALVTCSPIIVPAVAVDRAGTRLGRGGGSFDRALARVPAVTPVLALLYPGELRDRLPADPHDRPVTGVILPTGLVELSEPRREGRHTGRSGPG